MPSGFILFFFICVEGSSVKYHVAAVLIVVVEALHVLVGRGFHIQHGGVWSLCLEDAA